MTGPVLETSDGRLIDLRRDEADPCERLTPSCPIAHEAEATSGVHDTRNTSCTTW